MARPSSPSWLPWLVFGPLLVGSGAGVGYLLSGSGSGAAVWSEASGSEDAIGLPSLAPIVERVKSGVVSIWAVGRDQLDGELSANGGVKTGTGFVVNTGGLVVTTHHLVAEADQIIVYVPGHAPRHAEVIGEDPLTDLVVLRLDDPPEDLTALELGGSEDLRQGDWVLTLGNPFNRLEQTLTVGVVSFLSRKLPAGRVTNDYLQFSAPINPGSSGGPVLDLAGNVVGIATRIAVAGEGLSFAIPSKTIKWVLDAMESSEDGLVHWGSIGVTLESLSRDSMQEGQEILQGALVTQVTAGEPAARAGLEPMDVVTAFNDQPISNAADLHAWILCSPPGSTVRLEVLRNGQVVAPLEVVLGEVDTSSGSTVSR